MKDPIPQVLKDIKSVKIQGATNVAVAALTALKRKIQLFPEISKADFLKDTESFKNVRATEPMTKNAMNFLESRIQADDVWRKKITAEINLFLSRIGDVSAQIVFFGADLFKRANVVMTHCHSSSVEKIILAAAKTGKNLTVFVTETRPLNQGRITARNLTHAGIKVIMITDSLAPNILINGYEEGKTKLKIDMVLVGADAISKTGGVVFNKVGTFALAQAASTKKTPLYVVVSLLKVTKDKVEIELRKDKEIYKLRQKNFDAYNPAFDKVPSEYVTAYLTEFGLVKQKKIKYLVDKYYPFILERRIRASAGEDKIQTRMTKGEGFNQYLRYLHLGEKPNLDESLLATYRLSAQENTDFSKTAGAVAAESSVGTWTSVKTQFEKTWGALRARVFEADEKTGILRIAYPLELFEEGNLAQLMSSVAGNIFGLKEVRNLRLLDLQMPETYVKSFDGPAIGMDGIFKIVGVTAGPLIGSIIKPKLGLDTKEHVRVAMEVFKGGGDLVKDDENLTSQKFNQFFNRVQMLTDEMKKFKYLLNSEGEKIYAFNVTAEATAMKERASFIKWNGGNCAMIDVLTIGFSAVQFLRRQNLGLIIHGHRAMHAALTRDKAEGVSMLVLAKLARLAGVDELHTGTIVGKMEGEESEIVEINKFLTSEWFGLKKVLPVASGGLHPGLIPDLIKCLGKNVVYNFGGGIHGHPRGTYHGVKAVKEGVEAVASGVDWNSYVSTHEDLRMAIETWGR